jgi:hypothetical protein
MPFRATWQRVPRCNAVPGDVATCSTMQCRRGEASAVEDPRNPTIHVRACFAPTTLPHHGVHRRIPTFAYHVATPRRSSSHSHVRIPRCHTTAFIVASPRSHTTLPHHGVHRRIPTFAYHVATPRRSSSHPHVRIPRCHTTALSCAPDRTPTRRTGIRGDRITSSAHLASLSRSDNSGGQRSGALVSARCSNADGRTEPRSSLRPLPKQPV